MKIAVNLLYLEDNTGIGIGKHIEDILTGLEKMNALDEFYLIVRKTFYDNYFSAVNAERPFANAHVMICPESRLFKSVTKIFEKIMYPVRGIFLNRIIMPGLLKDINPELVFYPFNDSANNVSPDYPFVTVIHDLFYKNFSKRKRKVRDKLYDVYVNVKHKGMLKKSKQIIAISEFVKSDILKYFPGVESSKIVVIPNGVVMSGQIVEPDGIKKPFLLCVNDHGPHKNHLTLLKAFNIVKNKIPHNLVLLGREREETPAIIKYVNENGLNDKVCLISYVSDSERNWLYQNADLFISPSLHEGFGRTPIEAAMYGTMVLTSREASIPEVTCDLLNYYEPATDENALADNILKLLNNPVPVKERENIAKTYKELYDPVRVAKMYYDLFRSIVSNNKQ
jgi:glycosyltransferase involved in cell wall biosynthesis